MTVDLVNLLTDCARLFRPLSSIPRTSQSRADCGDAAGICCVEVPEASLAGTLCCLCAPAGVQILGLSALGFASLFLPRSD